MIRKVRFSNFYSFEGEQEIVFVAKKKRTLDYFLSKNDDYLTKIAGFIGGNASGKTNLMRLFSFLGYFVSRKTTDEVQQIPNIPYRTFFNNDKKSEFSVEYEIEDVVYFYNFIIRDNVVLEEELWVKKIQKGAKRIVVFKRKLDTVTYLNNDYFVNLPVEMFPKIRKDVSFITFFKGLAYSVDIINSVYDYFASFLTNINEKGEINHLGHQFKTLDVYIQDVGIRKEMEDFVRHFDLGLDGFEIKKETKDSGSTIFVHGLHRVKSKEVKLDFGYESRGTRSLFFTMANILSAIKNNRVVIIDEIEAGFHPEALNKLIGYFIDNNRESTAQLLFSSHSLGFMNKLDMHQIFLVEKNKRNESVVERLNNIEGIRPDENFLAKYMSGAYGSFPKIRV